MPEPLILKVQADTQGVPEGMNRVSRSVEGLDISSRKASNAIKGFVQDISQARDASDVASAALGAFSKVLGTSIAATGVVIAGKAIIDAFTNVSKIVEDTKDRVAKASAEIKKAGLDVGFSQAAGEAKKLSDEAENARANIEKLDKSFLMGLVATITGAREELGKLAQDAERLSQQRLFEGARAERIRTEERAGLTGGGLAIRDVEERLARELKAVNVLTPEGAKAAAELQKRAELDIQAIRQKAADEFDVKQAQQELKQRDAEIAGAKAAADIARKSDEEAAKRAEESIKRLEEDRAKKQEEIQKNQDRLNKDAVDLQEKQLSAQDRVNAARERLVRADAAVAETLLAPRPGQRPTSAFTGALKRAELAGQQEAFKQGEQAFKDFKAARETKGEPASRYAFNRAQEEALKQQKRTEAQAPFTEQRQAQKDLGSAESYLQNIETLLSNTLEDLKTYSHAG